MNSENCPPDSIPFACRSPADRSHGSLVDNDWRCGNKKTRQVYGKIPKTHALSHGAEMQHLSNLLRPRGPQHLPSARATCFQLKCPSPVLKIDENGCSEDETKANEGFKKEQEVGKLTATCPAHPILLDLIILIILGEEYCLLSTFRHFFALRSR
jgi:hypothetical protein